MYHLWKLALNPLTSALLLVIVSFLLCHTSVVTSLAVCFALGLCYYSMSPRFQANYDIWRRLAHGRSHPVRLADMEIMTETRPIVIVSFCEKGISWFDHALMYANSDFGRFGPWACFCLVNPLTSSFRMPLARFVLRKMGGILEYRREVFIDLMKRRNLHVSVILYDQFVGSNAGEMPVRLQNKGMFGAFLRLHAFIVPAVACCDGNVRLGSLLTPACSGKVPAPLEVRRAVKLFAEELQRLHVEVFDSVLEVED
ncbi:uncharacterized protein TM35_000371790 [Trypanosoma theileri]|uniref:Acyltransferase n=1 Tax=Trypanosoma theileri TaxID=67003 RepID=A0A1X0NKJ6_9TRYP|nr:uncharacterized protein TM35_000371790 [Trypanosoma theileri]ORC85206.1 hypothetical protein TM35_000371790 [Trypanosoma theileri]